MNIFIINSSSRINGNTSKVLDEYKKYFLQHNCKVTSLNLSTKNIKSCLGCRKCFDKGEMNCPLKDDLLEIVNLINNNDIVIFGTPIYVEDVNGILKNFIDRMAYNSHRPQFFKNKAYVITTSGVGSSNHGVQTLMRALQSWAFNVVGYKKYIAGANINKEIFLSNNGIIIEQEVNKILQHNNKTNIISLLYFKVQQNFYLTNSDKDTYDYLYWLKNGLLDKNSNYYYAMKVNKIKLFLVNILVLIIRKLILK